MRIAGLAQEPIPIKASTETATENGAKLWRAARFGQLPRVQRLLKLGANVGYRCNEHGTTALHQAAGNSHKDVMEALLESDANVDDMDHEGKTALHYATSVDIVKSLVMAGADVDHEGREGRTPGCVALVRKSTAVLNAFIEGLADPSKIFEPRLRTDSSRFETSGKLSEGEETDLQDYHALRAPDRQNRSLCNRILSVQDATQCASRTSPVMYQALQARETAINFRQLITPLPWTTNLPHGYFEDVQVVYAVESEGKSPGSYANNQDDEHGMTRTDLPLHKYFVQHMMSDDPSVRRVVGAA